MTRLPLVTAVIAFLSALPCAAQPDGAPTTAKDVRLKTKTPLGDAAIVWPAGSVLTEPVGTAGEIVVRQGPFTARLDRAEVVFPVVPVAAGALLPAPEPDPALRAGLEGKGPHPTWFEDWRVLGPAGAAVLLGLYSLATTAALVRGRRKAED
ncbi:MAG: hypothetical protein WEB31_05110 [Chthoniobacterales bacterium]